MQKFKNLRMRLIHMAVVIGLGAAASACVVAPPPERGERWCYNHPNQCDHDRWCADHPGQCR